MLVYSEISCEEMRSLPIFFACVSTWRYRLRRAATPTVNRSATVSPSFASELVTTRHILPGDWCSMPREPSAEPRPKHVGVDDVRERAFSVDLDDGKPLAVDGLEARIAADVDKLQLEAELRAHLLDNLERPPAQVARLRVVQRHPAHATWGAARTAAVRPTSRERKPLPRVGEPCGSPAGFTGRARGSSSPRLHAGGRRQRPPCACSSGSARGSARSLRRRGRRCRSASR